MMIFQVVPSARFKGVKILLSEYNAPSGFNCIWSKEITNSLNQTKTYKPIEKLFILE